MVTSLYGDPNTLVIGSLGTLICAWISAFATSENSLLFCAMGMTLITFLRARDMRRFARTTGDAMPWSEARHWELRYVVGASAYVLLMGLWCFFALTTTGAPYIQLLCFSMTLVNMIGVAGRNFGSDLLVKAQLLCAGVPMVFGLMRAEDRYLLLLAVVLVPFFVSFKSIADRLRVTLTEAVTAASTVRQLADRLDAAVNNMAHGLCAVDSDGRISLFSDRLLLILGLSKSQIEGVETVGDLLRLCRRARIVSAAQLREFVETAVRPQQPKGGVSATVHLSDGRILALTVRPAESGAVALVEDVTEKMDTAARLVQLAHNDTLTGLPNRALFRQTVSQVIAGASEAQGAAVLFIDLDHFKQVNDTLGHPCGDQLLKIVAKRLQELCEPDDFVARWGGDELVVARPRIAGDEELDGLAAAIVASLSRPYYLEGHEVVVGASVGIAVAPRDGKDVDVLLKNADLALYQAKADGRGGWRFFEPAMDDLAQKRRALETDLRAALANGGFEVFYQPIVNARRGRIAACEALVRWNRPGFGYVPPDVFIPVAEEMGLIVQLGDVVLQRACQQACSWPPEVRVAVNVSAIQFRRGAIIPSVRRALAETGLSPDRLEIEITESVLIQDQSAALTILEDLRRIGVRISLDDFGTGYSSLSYLRRFPFQKVKVDRIFLRDIETDEKAQTLLRGISRLCASLGMSVVVEGVEEQRQVDMLAQVSEIEEVQGYLFGRPAPAEETRRLLQAFGTKKQSASPRNAA